MEEIQIDLVANEPRPAAPGDYVQIDQEPHFTGVVKAADGEKVIVDCVAGLFLARLDEVSVLRRAA